MEPEEILISIYSDNEEVTECIPEPEFSCEVDEFYENNPLLLYEEPIPDKNSFIKFLSNGSSDVEKDVIQICSYQKKVDEEVDQENPYTSGIGSIDSKTDDSDFFLNKIFSSCQGYSTTNFDVEPPLTSSKKYWNDENSKVKKNYFKEPVVVSKRKKKSESRTKRKESQEIQVNTSNTTNDGMDNIACSSKTLTEAEKIIASKKLKLKKGSKAAKNSKSNASSQYVNKERKKSLRSLSITSYINSVESETSKDYTKTKAVNNPETNAPSRDVINKRKKSVRRSVSVTSDINSIKSETSEDDYTETKAVKNSETNAPSRDVINQRKKSVRRSLSITSDINSVEGETSNDDFTETKAVKNSETNAPSRDVINKRKKSVSRSLSITSDINSVESETSNSEVSVTSTSVEDKAIIQGKNLQINLIDIIKYPQVFKRKLQENGDLSLVNKFIKTSHVNTKLGNAGAVAEEAGILNQVACKPTLLKCQSSSEEVSETPRNEHMDIQTGIKRQETISAGEIMQVIQQQNILIKDLITFNDRSLQQLIKITSILERIEENTNQNNNL